MRTRLFLSLLVLGQMCAVAMAQEQPATVISPSNGGGATYITHVTVIDMASGNEIQDRTVIISGDRISDVRDSEGVNAPAGAKVVDGRGRYLIPGLWDMHVHRTEYESAYGMYIANGVTGVRDMDGPLDANKFRAELAAKKIDAPHMFLGSPIVDGYPPRFPDVMAVRTVEEARRFVDEHRKRGADFIKVYDRLSRDSYFAIIDEGRRQGISVVGHVPFVIGAWEASDSGQKSIEHLHAIPLACSSREPELRAKLLASETSWKVWNPIYVEAYRSYADSKCPVPITSASYLFLRSD